MKEKLRGTKEKIRTPRKARATTHGENPAERVQEDTADQARGILELTGKIGEVVDELRRDKAGLKKFDELLRDSSSEAKWMLAMMITQGRLPKKHNAVSARDIAREALEAIPVEELQGYLDGISDPERVKFCIFFIDIKTVAFDTSILKEIVAYAMNAIQAPSEAAKVKKHPMIFMFFSPI